MDKKEQKIVSIVWKNEEKDEKGVLRIIASDESIDRDGDIIRAKGWKLENYMKNPVILTFHNWRGEPVARANKVYINEDKLVIEGIDFADTEEGNKFKYLVENEFIKTVSVGFMPIKTFYLGDENEFNEMKSLDNEWVEKNLEKLAKAKRVIWEAELFEVSFVPIPANPNAMVIMASKGLETAYVYDAENKLIEIDLTNYEVKNPIPPSVHPRNMKLDKESSWSKDKAVSSLRKWASSDGSGDKDKINWTKYRKGFTWYDANDPENFGSYKYPTHWIDGNGNFVLVWRGTASAMAYFNTPQGRKNIPADDYRGVYNHLASEYRKFGEEPPPFKEKAYTPEECFKYYDPVTLEEYIKIAPDEVIKFIKNKLEEINKLQKEIEDLKSANNSQDDHKSEPPPSEEKEGADNGSDKKIVLTNDELSNVISLAVEQFLKTFKGGK